LPFIPQRENEGYGLSKAGIDHVDAQLIITVDSGIVAHEAIDYAHSKGIKVIVIDHHEKPKKLPKADAIIHTTHLCSAGIAYFFANQGLELAAIATVCDMVPLTGANRAIVKYGLKSLNETKRPGLKALFEVAGIKTVGTYELGFMIGPRLNAAGRIDSALTALRLLCTHDPQKAFEYAQELNSINRERQTMMENSVAHALENSKSQIPNSKIIVIDHESYHQGIIGLIAGKLTEKHYLPSIVISRGEEVSKASARSIAGFNIIEAIRSTEEILINAGGHPTAAGFTIRTAEISKFKTQISKYASKKLTDDLLEKTLKVDAKIPLELLNLKLYTDLQQLEPHGLGNPQPVFCSDVEVLNVRTMGPIGQHIKLTLSGGFEAVGFNMSHFASKLKAGQKISLAYSLDLNTFNSKTTLQLKIKDIMCQGNN
jgi:single-stranded-DNA-specific exonuclease